MMYCRIFRSDHKSETYLFLALDQLFEDLPETLRTTFGEPVFVMDLTLTADSKLARMNARSVLESLQEQGYFLQLPPELPLEEEISQRFS
jgi:uncharacterized protein YcgL (UPF0745 family)